MAGFVYGVRLLPLTTAYAISFVAPLLVTAMAVPILGEKVGPRRWAAIFVGLVGVLVVLRPTGQGMMTLGGLAILGAAVCYRTEEHPSELQSLMRNPDGRFFLEK